ncbi:MAG TPA: maleylpyruvate isomerase family mycothiol-dependent enzyme [Actinomycetales bacterium]|jgi:uncharacterized protein (TIGR03086 family)
MQPQITDFLDNAARLTAVVRAVPDWSAASPCEGWSAADVLDHVIDTQRDFLAQRGHDLGERPQGEPPARWEQHLAAVRAVAEDDAVVTREYDGWFGRTTMADTLRDFYGFDLVVHRWDIARASGQEAVLSDDELTATEQAVAGFGDALYSEGICARPVPVRPDASRQQRVLATLGRRA